MFIWDKSNIFLQKNKSIVLTLLLTLSILLSCKGFCTDIYNTLHYGGIDLRNRVVGARLLIDGYDPYFFTWTEEYPEKYLDPNDRTEIPITRVTVPPTVLMLHASFSDWDYRQQRILWFVVQWLSLLSTLYLFAARAPSKEKALLIWIFGLLFISCNPFWRFHVERGQIYIFYVLILAISYYLLGIQYKHSEFISGIMTGFVISLRPLVALMTIPVICFRKFSMMAGMAIGCASSLGISLICFGIKPWASYFPAMRENEVFHLNVLLGEKLTALPNIPLVENMNLQSYYHFPVIDTSLQAVFGYGGITLHSSWLLLLLTLLVFLLIYLLYRKSKLSNSNELVFLFGTFLILIAEFFIPAFRYTYNNVIWIIPITINIISLSQAPEYIRPWFYLFIGFIFSFSNIPLFLLVGNYWVAITFIWFVFRKQPYLLGVCDKVNLNSAESR